MCRFLLWMIALLYTIDHSEGEYNIKARLGIITTRNYQTASFEWDFNFPENTAIFMEVETVTDLNVGINKIAYKAQNGQFQAYGTMRDRVKISIPLNRHGVIIDISNIVISDGGNYICTARLLSGKILKNITKLVVIVPPRINNDQLNLHRNEGQNASLLCNLDAGNPKPLTFQWFRMKDGYKNPQTPVKLRDYNLTYYIENVGRESLGKYRCDVGGQGGTDSHVVHLFVKYKPVVTAPPLNRTVFEKFGLETLRCTCDGNAGRTRYHWYKDYPYIQHEIQDGNRNMLISSDRKSLKFTRPPRTLAAIYYCAGSNDLGTGKPEGAYLNVTYKPGPIEILTTPDGTTINGIEGENMTINCHSDANPPAHYNWYKRVKTFWGKYVREHIIKYSLTGDIKLYRVDRNDTAKYICEALNRPNDEDTSRVYSIERKVKINIRFGPRQTNFTVNDKNYTYIEVKEGSEVTIRCVSHSEPGANYNIRKERVPTQLNTNLKVGIYTMKNIAPSNEGVYVCISSNEITRKHQNRKIDLVVAVPPTTVAPEPGNKLMEEGATVEINCHSKGKPAPRVYWQRYGANITHNDSVIQTYYTVRPLKEGILSIVDAQLKFTGIRYTDDASYSCIVYNSAGKINITNIHYSVQYSPKITTRPENLTMLEGQKATFVCLAFANPPSVQWKWLFNDKELIGVTSNIFIRPFTSREDNGYYKCVPRNGIGQGQIGTGHLEVQYEPSFTVKPEGNYTRDATESLTIRCDAKAVPTPQIFWRKFGDSTFQRYGKDLVFLSLKPNDIGQYSCIARNIISSKSAKTLVIVRHRPIITTTGSADTKIGSKDGYPVSLRCHVNAYPAASIQWREKIKDTIIVDGEDYKIEEEKTLFGKSSTLKFTVHSYQLGKKYVCVSRNVYGHTSQIFQVLVTGKPDPPESGSLKAVDELVPTVPVTVNINFTWIPGYNGGETVEFYLLFKEKKESRFHEQYMRFREGFKYVFTSRKAGASYVFTMKAKNKYGLSQWYKPYLDFNTKDPPPDVANVTIKRVGRDGTSIRIFWNIFPTKVERKRRAIENRWDYGIIRYRFADSNDAWKEEKIREIAMKGSYLIEELKPERLYVFHFILYDKSGTTFGNPILIGRIYPRYGPALPSRSELTKTDIIAIGVACGGAILIVSIIILIIAICKKKKKPAYGIASYGNGRPRVDIPVSTTMKSGGYTEDAVRASYFKDDDDDDEDPLAVDSGSGLDAGDKSPPPDYNAVHYSVAPRDNNPNQSSFSDDMSPKYTTFGRLAKNPQYSSKDDGLNQARSVQSLTGSRATEIARGQNRHSFDALDDYPTPYRPPKIGLGQPLLRKSINDLDDEYRKPPERNQGLRNSRGRLSSDEDILEPPSVRVPPPDEADMNNRVPGAFGDRAQRFKKPPYKSYDDENGSISPPNPIGSGRQSPNGSSVASSKPYRSDNEYIEEAEENYIGYLV